MPTVSPLRTAGAAILGSFALRIAYAFHHQVNTDEPQHLYLAWTWVRGLVPYRDAFDNHMPLVHLLAAPVAGWLGEAPDLVCRMRLAMLPFSALLLACTWVVARRTFGSAAAASATALLALFPRFLLTSTEFRPDVVWAACSWAAIAVLVSASGSTRRIALAGLLAGLGLAASIKGALVAAAIVFAVLAAPRPVRFDRTSSLVAALGFVLPTAALSALFAALGALGAMIDGVVRHNASGSLSPAAILIAVAGIAVTAALIRRVRTLAGEDAAFVFTLLGAFLSFVPLSPPLFSPQTGLMLYPGFAILVGALAVRLPAFPSIVAAACAIEVLVLTIRRPPWQDRTWPQTQLVAEALALTTPDETVMDLKGEAIFRQRAFFYPLEDVTLSKIAAGDIPDSIPERLVETRTMVARVDSPKFPPRARAFLNASYVPVSPRTRVAGTHLDRREPRPGDSRGGLRFEIGIPGSYVVVSDRGAAVGVVDGTPWLGPRFLSAGEHVFVPANQAARFAVIWARAAELGFSPF